MGVNRHNFARIALKSAISGFDQWFLLIVLKILFSPTLWSIEKFPIDPCPSQHKKPPSRERRRKSSQRGSLAIPLESIICPLELAGESYRRVWGDYLCSSPMVFQLCSASLAPSLNGFRLLTSASFFTSCCVDFQSINHVTKFLPVIRIPCARRRGYVIICADGLKLSCFGCRFWAFSAHKGICPTYVAIWLGSQPASNPHYTWISIFGKFSKKRGRGFWAVKSP